MGNTAVECQESSIYFQGRLINMEIWDHLFFTFRLLEDGMMG